ncbi:MAG: hypothetical protein SGCHY_002905 [Lobulomycetales sp.]
MNSYGNVTLTCQQSLHKSLKTATKSSASVGASDIASAAVWYSLAFNNLVYLVVLAVKSSFPVAVSYAVCACGPLVILTYLTRPLEGAISS